LEAAGITTVRSPAELGKAIAKRLKRKDAGKKQADKKKAGKKKAGKKKAGKSGPKRKK
jgi:hypothetical protein